MEKLNNRYHFAYSQDEQDKQLWIDADGFARAYDKFWSLLDGEDNIDNIEVEQHTLKTYRRYSRYVRMGTRWSSLGTVV